MKKVLNNIKGIDIIIEKYLKENVIPYEAYTFDDEANNYLEFEEISMLVHEDSVLADYRIDGVICKDKETISQVK